MIRLRTKTNKRFKVTEDVNFIEICDNNGSLGAVIHITPEGRISVALPGDVTYENYANAFNSERATLIKHDAYKKDND